MTQKLRIGTRGSKLAMIQTHMVRQALAAHHPALEIEIIEIKTSGDWMPEHGETSLAAAGGDKGLFAKEIEAALLAGAIDCGVHSMKDMPSVLPDGLIIRHVLPREDAREAFLSNDYKTIVDLPEGATVGTSSLRRQAMLLSQRPDLNIVPFRGNVPTRLEKLRAGQVDATILAMAGLNRLGMVDELSSVIDIEHMLPAAGQGAVGIEIRNDDDETGTLFDPIHCHETGLRVGAERAALQVLGGTCHTPVGAYATLESGTLGLDIVIASPDGQKFYRDRAADDNVTTDIHAQKIGRDLGARLKPRVPPELLSGL